MKSPAFQFYVKQWLGDDKVMLMDWDARGMHLHYMCIAWQMQPPCTLPDDDEMLCKWVGNPSDWDRLKKQIFRAWKLQNGVWLQEGLLREFEKQQKFSESRKKNAEARWDKERSMQVQSKCNALQSSSSSSTSIKKKRHIIAKTDGEKTTYNFETHSWENVSDKFLTILSSAYPAVDVDAELKAMAAWLEANPKNRKSDYPRFINNWLRRAQDKAPRTENKPGVW